MQAQEAAVEPEIERAAIIAAAVLAAREAERLPADGFEAAERDGRSWRLAGRQLAQGREPR